MGWQDIRDGNPVKERLTAGGTVIGSFVRMSSVEVTEASAHAGCDFVIIDAEHAPATWAQQSAMIIAAEAAGTVPILRVSNWSRDLITRALDAGAHGVMVPQIETVEAAEAAVAATHYGPGGTRGVAANRRSGYGLKMSYPEYVEASNRSTLVALQVETMAAVERVDEIAEVPGIDLLFVGLADLSTDLGIAGAWDDPTLVDYVERINAACRRNEIAFGLPVPNGDLARHWMERGARFVATGDIGVFANAMKAFIEEVRGFSD